MYQSSAVERIKLPTAPKASRGSDVDMSRIPVDPPYLAFIGNLPYEVSPEKIETFFGNLPVSIPDRLLTKNYNQDPHCLPFSVRKYLVGTYIVVRQMF